MNQYKQKLLKIIRQKRKNHNIEDNTSEESYQNIFMLQKAETEVIRMCHARHFLKEIDAVNVRNRMPSTNSIHKLDQYLDKDSALTLVWRLVKSNSSLELKHPVLVPK